jgi:hypothetical protein
MTRTLPRNAFAALGPLAATALLAVVVSPSVADAAKRGCQPRAGTIFTSPTTRVWHERRALFACTTATRTGRRVTTRLGPWTKGGHGRSQGSKVVWATRRIIDGVPVDRVWASSVRGQRFLAGVPAIPASSTVPEREGRVYGFAVDGGGVGWVTTTSDVAFAIPRPYGEPQAIGTLLAPLQPYGSRLLVGRWPAVAPATLAASVVLDNESLEGDDCGGAAREYITFRPDPAGEPVGVRWDGDIVLPPDACW